LATDGLLHRYPEEVQRVATVQVRTDYEAYRVERCFLRSEQGPDAFDDRCIDRPSGALLVLWGDSHAAALSPGLRQAGPAATPRLAQWTAAACPPLPAGFGPDNPHCDAIAAGVLARLTALRPDTVMLAANWPRYAQLQSQESLAQALQQTVRALRARGVANVVVMGPLPRWRVAPTRRILSAWRQGEPLPIHAQDGVDEALLDLDAQLERATRAEGARYVSALQALCDERGCRVGVRTARGLEAVAFDDSHLTVAGSVLLTRDTGPWAVSQP
jgi:hypothetical protein